MNCTGRASSEIGLCSLRSAPDEISFFLCTKNFWLNCDTTFWLGHKVRGHKGQQQLSLVFKKTSSREKFTQQGRKISDIFAAVENHWPWATHFLDNIHSRKKKLSKIWNFLIRLILKMTDYSSQLLESLCLRLLAENCQFVKFTHSNFVWASNKALSLLLFFVRKKQTWPVFNQFSTLLTANWVIVF